MNVIDFLNTVTKPEFYKSKPVIVVQSASYPFLFFQRIFVKLQQDNIIGVPLKKFVVQKFDEKLFYSTMQQSVLGSYYCYWLADLMETITARQRKKMQAFLSAYQGPHIIMLFASDKAKLNCGHVIELDEYITSSQGIELARLFDVAMSSRKQALIKNIFDMNKKLSLETYSKILQYISVSGDRLVPELLNYLSGMFEVTPTLNQLAEHFFTKNGKRFFQLWQKVYDNYSEMFWLTFWAEQVWRAYHTSKYLQKRDFVKAKKMSYRLPYAFLSRDWKRHSLQDLCKLHEDLYDIDFAFKRGSSFCLFDRFYINHFKGATK